MYLIKHLLNTQSMDQNYQTGVEAKETTTVQHRFMVWVYRWMTLGLALTALVAMLVYSNKPLLQYIDESSWAFTGIIIAELAVVFILSYNIKRMSLPTAAFMFLLYSALNGFAVSAVIAIYTAASVGYALFIAALMFGIMSVYGYFTKSDLTKFGNLLYMALIGLIIAFVVNYFWFNSTIYWVISIIGVFIFVGLTAYDTQALKRIGDSAGELDSGYMKLGVLGALMLYLDFINIFFLLLGVSGRSNN